VKHNRFKAESGAFKCYVCKKLTRDTGHNEAELGLCKKCLFKCYVENTASDYGVDSPEHKEAVANYEALK